MKAKGLIYSVISPIIIPIQVIIFALFWASYSNFTISTPEDNGGLFYPKALKHLLVGIYAMELGLAVLFILVRDSSGRASCIGQACLMIFAIVLTAIFHHYLCKAFDPLLLYTPLALELVQLENESPFIPMALTSTPVIRLPRDQNGVSRAEIARLKDYGIEAQDDEATLTDAKIQLNYDGGT